MPSHRMGTIGPIGLLNGHSTSSTSKQKFRRQIENYRLSDKTGFGDCCASARTVMYVHQVSL